MGAFVLCLFVSLGTLFADLFLLKTPLTHSKKIYTWLTRTPKEKMEADINCMKNKVLKMFFEHQNYGQILLFFDRKISGLPMSKEEFVQTAIDQNQTHIKDRKGTLVLNKDEYRIKQGKLFDQLSTKCSGKNTEELQRIKDKYKQEASPHFERKIGLEMRLDRTQEAFRSLTKQG